MLLELLFLMFSLFVPVLTTLMGNYPGNTPVVDFFRKVIEGITLT